jgi:dTDP-4-dehydrorhamnose 3,5-epimerase
MKVVETSLPGCLVLQPRVVEDPRGAFVKTFRRTAFEEAGLPGDFPEHFLSRSSRGVVRGLHFQLPPADHDKVVCCTAGEVFDVVVDLRVGSPAYGRFETFRLDDRDWTALFVPRGFAHGFAALSEQAVTAYLTSTEFEPALDAGIRWDSLPIPWPVTEPVVSERDRALPPFEAFVSPWTFEGSS